MSPLACAAAGSAWAAPCGLYCPAFAATEERQTQLDASIPANKCNIISTGTEILLVHCCVSLHTSNAIQNRVHILPHKCHAPIAGNEGVVSLEVHRLVCALMVEFLSF